MRRKQAGLRFKVATEARTSKPERSSTANQGSHPGTPQRRRQYRTCRKRAGSHKHCPRPLPGALPRSNERGNTRMDSATADIWEIQAKCFQLRLLHHSCLLSMRGFRLTAIIPTIFRLYLMALQSLARATLKSRRGPQYGHIPVGKHINWFSSCVIWSSKPLNGKSRLSWTAMLQWPLIVSLTHLIVDAMEAMKVPLVLVSAWLREYIGSGTFIQLDDIMTLGIRCARSVPQADPCAADLFGAAVDVPTARCCDTCQSRKWGAPVEVSGFGVLGC